MSNVDLPVYKNVQGCVPSKKENVQAVGPGVIAGIRPGGGEPVAMKTKDIACIEEKEHGQVQCYVRNPKTKELEQMYLYSAPMSAVVEAYSKANSIKE